MTDPAALTTAEQAALTSGADFWTTKAIEDVAVILGPGINLKRSPLLVQQDQRHLRVAGPLAAHRGAP